MKVRRNPSESPISRIIRSLVAPIVSCCKFSMAPVDENAMGNCQHQVGAEVRMIDARRSRAGPSSNDPSHQETADKLRRCHTVLHNVREQWTNREYRARERRKNSSPSEVLPMPGSPVMSTTRPLPSIDCCRYPSSLLNSGPRPTNGAEGTPIRSYQERWGYPSTRPLQVARKLLNAWANSPADA